MSIDFHKNEYDEYEEGYLGKPTCFNGIVFLLREPNKDEKNTNKSDEKRIPFWFKNVVNREFNLATDADCRIYLESDDAKKVKKAKTAATKYVKRFKEMLKFINCPENFLKDAVYCNIHPKYGEKYKSKDYMKTIYQNTIEKINLLEKCADKRAGKHDLIIFTCYDIYNILKEYYCEKTSSVSVYQEGGLKYTQGKNEISKNMFKADVNGKTVTVYEMFHPCYGSSIKVN